MTFFHKDRKKNLRNFRAGVLCVVETYRKRATPRNYIKVEQVHLVMKLLREQGVVLDGKYTSQSYWNDLVSGDCQKRKVPYFELSPEYRRNPNKVLPYQRFVVEELEVCTGNCHNGKQCTDYEGSDGEIRCICG